MLVAGSAETLADLDNLLLQVDGPQNHDALLADLTGANTDPSVGDAKDRNPVVDAIFNPMNESIPNLGTGAPFDSFLEGVVVPRNGNPSGRPFPQPPAPSPEPHGYQYQTRS